MMQKTAWISQGGLYRYGLSRIWKPSESQNLCGWVMLNPSKADANRDDNTIKRCIKWSAEWGFDGMMVANLFAFRSTDPRELEHTPDPVGEDNNEAIVDLWAKCPVIIAAWGTPQMPFIRERAEQVCRLLYPKLIHCLQVTKNGDPHHPRGLPNDVKPIVWRMAGQDAEYINAS